MEIELATIEDVPALLDLQRKAFGPLCEELDWKDAPVLTESLEHAYEELVKCVTLKVQNQDGLLIGSVNGNVIDGSLYIGRLMVLPSIRNKASASSCSERFNHVYHIIVLGSARASRCALRTNSIYAKDSGHIRMRQSAQD